MAQVVAVKDLNISDILTFLTYGNNTVPNVTNGELLAIESGHFLRDPNKAAVNHSNIYSTLPPSNPRVADDYTSYSYLLIKLKDNSIVEVGIPWIQPVSLTRLVRKTATIIINDYDETLNASCVNALAALGFVNIDISVS